MGFLLNSIIVGGAKSSRLEFGKLMVCKMDGHCRPGYVNSMSGMI